MSVRSNASLSPPSSAFLFFGGVFLLYLSLSPLNFRINGYMEEERAATVQLLEFLGLITDPDSASTWVQWPRNGLLPLMVHLPFVLFSRWAFGPSLFAESAVLAFQPILLSAASATIVFLWARELTGSGLKAIGWALATGFSTMLWPYAYIGLETQQSFFVLLAAYLAIGRGDHKPGIAGDLLFAFSCSMAVGVKSTGALLVPAVGFLMVQQVRAGNRRRAMVCGIAVLGALLFSAWSRSFFWNAQGGSGEYLKFWIVRDPFSWLLNVVAFIGSPNKGLVVFSPVLFLGLASLPGLLKRRSPLAVFSILVLAGLAGGFALLRCWADENWGPRYLHSAVAPLVLCLACAWESRPASERKVRAVVLALLLVIGSGVSALGALFWYGSLHQVSIEAQENVMERIQGDIALNHILFNGRLFRIWVSGRHPEEGLWTPQRTWYFQAPRGWEAPPPVNLATFVDTNARPVAVPQSYAIAQVAAGHQPGVWISVLLIALVAGAGLVIMCARSSRTVVEPELHTERSS